MGSKTAGFWEVHLEISVTVQRTKFSLGSLDPNEEWLTCDKQIWDSGLSLD